MLLLCWLHTPQFSLYFIFHLIELDIQPRICRSFCRLRCIVSESYFSTSWNTFWKPLKLSNRDENKSNKKSDLIEFNFKIFIPKQSLDIFFLICICKKFVKTFASHPMMNFNRYILRDVNTFFSYTRKTKWNVCNMWCTIYRAQYAA